MQYPVYSVLCENIQCNITTHTSVFMRCFRVKCSLGDGIMTWIDASFVMLSPHANSPSQYGTSPAPLDSWNSDGGTLILRYVAFSSQNFVECFPKASKALMMVRDSVGPDT